MTVKQMCGDNRDKITTTANIWFAYILHQLISPSYYIVLYFYMPEPSFVPLLFLVCHTQNDSTSTIRCGPLFIYASRGCFSEQYIFSEGILLLIFMNCMFIVVDFETKLFLYVFC